MGEKEEHFLLSRGGLQHRRVTTFCFHSTVTTHDRFSVPRDPKQLDLLIRTDIVEPDREFVEFFQIKLKR